MHPHIEFIPVSIGLSLLAVVLVCTATDLAWRRIANTVLLPALALAIMLQASGYGWDGFLSAVAGAFVGLVFFMPHYALGGMSAGDVKLLGVVGAYLGPWGVLLAGASALVAGAIFGVVYIVWRCFGPMVSYQVWKLAQLQLVSGGQLLPPPPMPAMTEVLGGRFAYAPAIAAGTMFAMWHQGLIAKLIVAI